MFYNTVDGFLYGYEIGSAELYKINPSDGVIQLISDGTALGTGLAGSGCKFSGGVLYAIGSPGAFFSVNLQDGIQTLIFLTPPLSGQVIFTLSVDTNDPNILC